MAEKLPPLQLLKRGAPPSPAVQLQRVTHPIGEIVIKRKAPEPASIPLVAPQKKKRVKRVKLEIPPPATVVQMTQEELYVSVNNTLSQESAALLYRHFGCPDERMMRTNLYDYLHRHQHVQLRKFGKPFVCVVRDPAKTVGDSSCVFLPVDHGACEEQMGWKSADVDYFAFVGIPTPCILGKAQMEEIVAICEGPPLKGAGYAVGRFVGLDTLGSAALPCSVLT